MAACIASAQVIQVPESGLSFKAPDGFAPADESSLRFAEDCLPMLRGPKVRVVYCGKIPQPGLDTTLGVIVAPFPFGDLPKDTIVLMKRALDRQGDKYTLLSKGTFEIGSRKAYLVVVSRPGKQASGRPAVRYCQFLAMTAAKGDAFYFVCTARQEDFPLASKAYSSFLENVHWIDVKPQ